MLVLEQLPSETGDISNIPAVYKKIVFTLIQLQVDLGLKIDLSYCPIQSRLK